MKKYSNKSKKDNYKNKVIARQMDRIETLRKTIFALEIDNVEKDKIIGSVDSLRNELITVIEDLKEKDKEYDKLIDELIAMRNVMNQEVFKGKWKIIKWLIK